MLFDRRKFRSQTSDNMDRWKAEQGRGREKRKIRREKIRRERVRGQKIQMREKVGKSRNTVFFQGFVAPEVVAWSTFPSQNVQNTPAPDHFWKLRCQKVYAVVARSTLWSQNVQNTPFSDHLWRFKCWKSVEKVHAVVARSTFRSQKCKKLRVLSLFWREDVEKVDTD